MSENVTAQLAASTASLAVLVAKLSDRLSEAESRIASLEAQASEFMGDDEAPATTDLSGEPILVR